MKSSIWLFAAAVSVSGLALAQTAPSSTVTEINDPAKIAEIERHAEELAARQAKADERGHAQKHKQKHGKSHHKNKAKQQPAAQETPPSDTPMAPEPKR